MHVLPACLNSWGLGNGLISLVLTELIWTWFKELLNYKKRVPSSLNTNKYMSTNMYAAGMIFFQYFHYMYIFIKNEMGECDNDDNP